MVISMLKEHLYKILWSVAIATTVIGVITFVANQDFLGIALIAVGGSSLTLSVIWTEIQLVTAGREDSFNQLVLLYGEAATFYYCCCI